MSASRFSRQIEDFLQSALQYGVSSIGRSDAAIRLETAIREDFAERPAPVQAPKRGAGKPAGHAMPSTRKARDAQSLVSLGLCGFNYRLVLLFQIDDDATAHAFFGGDEVQASLSEFVNLVCGSLNRSLQRAYPSTGMSTPFSMSGTCFGHLGILRPDLSATLSFLVGENVRLRVAYALSTGKSFDFVENVPAEETESMGELELF